MRPLVVLVEPWGDGWQVHVPELHDASGYFPRFDRIRPAVLDYAHAHYVADDGFDVVIVLLDEWLAPQA